ncbi:MAG: hypothetical protein JWQ70_1099 [Aeromicrobium sp.]|nr:hypothetical protein [Aeromicrobium sp.]
MLSGFTRELDPAEVYFELVGRTWPMIALSAIEFDEAFTVDQVEKAWNTLAEQVPAIGVYVERTSGRDARMVFGRDHGPLPVTRYADLPSAWAGESRAPVDIEVGPVVRCAMVEGDSGATVVITSHHAIMDGKYLADLGFLFAQVLVGRVDVADSALAEPTLPLHPAGHQPPRAEMLATARLVRDEAEFVGNADTLDWHQPLLDPPRDVGFAVFHLTETDTAGLLAWSRTHSTTVQGALSAALISAAASMSPGLTRIALSTSVDLRARFDPPPRGLVGQAAGVISGSYETAGSSGEIARLVSSDIRRRFDRGEAELLYALSGAGRFPINDTTDRVIKRWTAEATPALSISNMGVVTGSAPESLRRLSVGLAPTPNQAVYFAASTFRGGLTITVGFDQSRLTIDGNEFASTIHSHVLELARSGEQLATAR